MTAALALMAGDRGDMRFVHQSMYYPVLRDEGGAYAARLRQPASRSPPCATTASRTTS